jgi:uncharacterized protein (TIGR03000 family)
MNLASMKKLLVAGVAVVALSACAAQANAHWWGAAPAYYGGWDGCGWSSCDPCGYGYYGAYRGCHRSYRWGCGYGWNSCYDPCNTCCYTAVSCCGYTTLSSPIVSSCGCGGVVVSPTVSAESTISAAPTKAVTPAVIPSTPATTTPTNPVIPSNPIEKPAAPGGIGIPGATTPAAPGGLLPPTPTPTGYNEPTSKDSGYLTVWVPFEAKVTVNGMATKSTGSRRTFVSYGLRPGYTYKYEVKAEIVREGKVVAETQTISLTAGERGGLAFGFNTVSAEGLAQAE